jgi:hypothetical protein
MPKSAKPKTPATVDDLVRALEHPLKPELEVLRALIVNVSPTISEGVKWNSPSYRTVEWFATIHLRGDALQIVLHLGAKATDRAAMHIDDPAGLLTWLGKDRAVIKLADMGAIETHRTALEDILRQWITYVE